MKKVKVCYILFLLGKIILIFLNFYKKDFNNIVHISDNMNEIKSLWYAILGCLVGEIGIILHLILNTV